MDFLTSQFDKFFLLAFTVLFFTWEKVRPARKKRFRIERLDLIAIANLFVFSLVSKWIFTPANDWSQLAPFSSLPSFVKYPLAIICVDFALYWVHVFSHKSLLWNTHRFHHSVRQMDWLKGSYTSGIHIAMYVIPQLVIAYYLFGFTKVEMLCAVSFGYFVQLWQHANITVPIGPLKYIFVSPQSHRMHHGLEVRDRNFGAIFSTWDYIFGTAANPNDEAYDLGIKEEFKLVRGLIGY